MFNIIDNLIEDLSTAIRNRHLHDKSFDIYEHMIDPIFYKPFTGEELSAWRALITPENYDDLLIYVRQRRSMQVSGYALIMDVLVLQAAQNQNGYHPTIETIQLADEQLRRLEGRGTLSSGSMPTWSKPNS